MVEISIAAGVAAAAAFTGGVYLVRRLSAWRIRGGKKGRKASVRSEKTVMVVTGNARMRDYLCSGLMDSWNVIEASSIQEAKESVASALPKVILLDTGNGSKGEYTFMLWLKSNGATANIPIVSVSSYSKRSFRITAFNAGAEACFFHPFYIDEVGACLESVAKGRETITDYYAGIQGKVTDADFLARLGAVMSDHMSDENLSVGIMAEEMNMSTSSLFKRLKSLKGISPGEYVTEARMKEAASLLKDTALTVDDISIRCGFRSLSYFSTCFKTRFGVSPKKYRLLSEP